MTFKTFATLTENAQDLIKIFPDRRVPITSIVPMKPREESASMCYVVDVGHLTEYQIERLAWSLYQIWADECKSVEEAIEYIRDPGLPLRTDHFSSVTSSSPAVLFGWMDDFGFERQDDDDDDDVYAGIF